MLLRKLLACLALLSGLAAAGTPAHAQVAAVLTSAAEESQAGVAEKRPAMAEAAGASHSTSDCAIPSGFSQYERTVAVVAVRIGIDRSRE